MLVLSRKINERIRISDDVVVEITGIMGGKVRLAIIAPKDVPIYREEVYLQRKAREVAANGSV
jgi:carbon storage regulator